jgi:ABC-type antimicrobial peptide transport system permease subunit
VLGVDPAIAHVETRPLSAALDGEMRPLRLGTVAFGSSSVLALVVAVLGLYSIMAYLVALRTREIGVRAALGATRGQISRLVVTNGITLAAVGVSLGLALAVGAGRWIEPHLFRTTATDPVVLGAVALILLAVAVLAAWIPARRAARISPTEALGAE